VPVVFGRSLSSTLLSKKRVKLGSRQLLTREGEPVVANLGNPWKGIYHTGRAVMECLRHIEALEGQPS